MSRIIATPQDVQSLTGLSMSHAYKYFSTMKSALDKKKHQFISLEELADYMGLDLDTVKEAIKA